MGSNTGTETASRDIVQRPGLVFLGFLALTIVVRAPFLNIVHEDEAFYAVIAQRWLAGEWPYASSFDVKPPMTFAILAVFQAAFGMHFWVIKLVEILFVAAGALGIWRLTLEFRLERAAIWAGILAIGFSLHLWGVSSPAQLIQTAFITWAFAEGVAALRNGASIRAFASGVFVGLAFLTKQTAVFDAFALGLCFLMLGGGKPPFRLLSAWVIGGLATVLACGVAFIAAGHGPDLFRDTVALAFARAGLEGGADSAIGPFGIGTRLVGLFASLAPLTPLLGAGLLYVTRYKRLAEVVSPDLTKLLAIWWICAGLGVLSFLDIQPWYSYPLIPPSVIAAAIVIEHGLGFRGRGRLALQGLVVVICILAGAIIDRDRFNTRDFHGAPDLLAARRAAALIKDSGVSLSERLLVPVRGQGVYVLTGNLPGTPYLNAAHLVCDFATPSQDPLGEALGSKPDVIVLSDTRYYSGCARPGRVERIEAVLQKDYARLGVVSGRWDQLAVYRLRK